MSMLHFGCGLILFECKGMFTKIIFCVCVNNWLVSSDKLSVLMLAML